MTEEDVHAWRNRWKKRFTNIYDTRHVRGVVRRRGTSANEWIKVLRKDGFWKITEVFLQKDSGEVGITKGIQRHHISLKAANIIELWAL